jgi:hypothetical protein
MQDGDVLSGRARPENKHFVICAAWIGSLLRGIPRIVERTNRFVEESEQNLRFAPADEIVAARRFRNAAAKV